MPEPRKPEAPARVGGRYVLGARIGGGAQGEVFAATDALSGDEAVLKWVPIPDEGARSRCRREIASLRGLGVACVARLLDAGEEPDALWLVMARVRGAPFPGPLPPVWSALAPCVEALLGALAAVHRLGLVHRDLKPGNVLVTDAGDPVIVDFGLAWSRGRSGQGAGTPLYMAPEQAADDEVDGRADLYAVGRMLSRTLDADPDLPEAVIEAITAMTAPDPEDRPASAGEALRLLGIDGRARAEDAVERLLPPQVTYTAAELEPLFAGHERVLRLKSDGARALWRRTGGRRDRMIDVLAAWVREGLARWEEGRFSLPRTSLDALGSDAWPSGEARADGLDPLDAAWLPWIHLLGADARADQLRALRPEAAESLTEALTRLEARGAVLIDGETPRVLAWPAGFRARLLPISRAEASRRAALLLPEGARLRHLIAAGEAPRAVAREALIVAERALQEGRPGAAISTLELVLPALRRADHHAPDEEARALAAWSRAALSLGTPRDLDRGIFELHRATCDSANTLALLVAARRSVGGDGEGALLLLDEIPALNDEALEIWRAAMRVHAARRCSPPRVEEVLDALAPWAAQNPDREAALAGWLGMLRYHQERYREAAELHERAALGKSTASGVRSSELNAACAWLELGELESTFALADRARQSAEASRHAHQTLEAERLCRAARLRQPDAATRERPDLELVEVAITIGRPVNGAVTALAEAALAARRGDAALTARLSALARRGFEEEHLDGPALLARGLGLALGGEESARLAVIHEAETTAAPGLAVQAAALAAWTSPSPALLQAARALIARRAPELRVAGHVLQEVLSLDEIVDHLGLSKVGTVHA